MEHWLLKRANLSPDALAIETADQQWTYRELYLKSDQFARKAAFLQGKHVAILSENCLEMVVAFWGCTLLGAKVVFLNTKLTERELVQQCDTADVEIVIGQASLLARLQTLTCPSYSYEDLKALPARPVELLTEINPSSICSMMFTSGTTGRAKAVVQTYENHWSSAIASALNLGLQARDKWLISLPLFHISGLSTVMKSVIYGMPIYLMSSFNAENINHAIQSRGITHISVVSTTCQRLLEELEDNRYPDTFRCMLLGGGPAPKSLLEKAANKGIPIIQTYGMTETCSQISTLQMKDALRKLGSAGKALFSASLEIRKGKEKLEANQIGEIVVKGPMVTPGYYQAEQANEQSFISDWFYTGDMGYVDEEGFLYVVDRRSDLIISGGENIYPAEIEDVLLSMEGIKEAGVTGREDKEWGQVPIAFVVSEKAWTEEELRAHCEQHLARFKVPRKFYFCKSLPRNATNKLQRHLLRKKLIK